MPARPDAPLLTRAALTRATLARQHLLDRARLDVADAAEAIGGLQAQEPASPFLALWTRLEGFRAADLTAAFLERRVVKATLMRATLHAVSAADHPLLQPAIRGTIRSLDPAGNRPTPAFLERIARLTATIAATPRSNTELRDELATVLPPDEAEAGWYWARRVVPLIHVPSASTPWAFGRRPVYVTPEAWLGPGFRFADLDAALVHLARRYLGAFGPASVAELASWARVAISSVRPAVAALDAEVGLCRFRDEQGRELLDLPDAPRPPDDAPVPPRLLAMWDSPLLAYADRTRIVDDAIRKVVIATNGDTLPTFLVDGRVAGLWWLEPTAGGRARVVLEPFVELSAATRRALEREGEAAAAFVEPHEPLAYSRYRRWSPARRAAATSA